MKNFYMTLLSNSSMEYFPDNRTSSFTVQLPRYMYLDGDWEVALTEIQYPYTFINVAEDQTAVRLDTIEITHEFYNHFATTAETKKFTNKAGRVSTHHIVPGYYSDIGDIVAAINGVITAATKQPAFFVYDTLAHKTGCVNSVQIGSKWIKTCRLSNSLALQLGYKPGELIHPNGKYGPYPANSGIIIPDKMLIYCDILEPQMFGDTFAKVLRMISTNIGDSVPYFGKQCSSSFGVPQYLPVQIKNFEAITIDIKDIEGRLMPFQYGTLSVKLHFRKKK